jgi:hypothetical protein
MKHINSEANMLQIDEICIVLLKVMLQQSSPLGTESVSLDPNTVASTFIPKCNEPYVISFDSISLKSVISS